MLIAITNTCGMGCPHCLQDSGPEEQHMSDETFERIVSFVEAARPSTVLVSGGEPTMHPKWVSMLDRLAGMGGVLSVGLLTNGCWLGNYVERDVLNALRRHEKLALQVTTVAGLYRDHARTLHELDRFKGVLKDMGLKRRMAVHTDGVPAMVELGRARTCEYARELSAGSKVTTSCFASALVAAQLKFPESLWYLESKTKFCHPLVDWQGGLHWSESWLCPPFANVCEPFDDICRKAHEWRPCGGCAGYGKLLARTEDSYVAARRLMGIGERHE